VSKITGLARSTINRGKADLDAQPLPKGRVRRAGGGRRLLCENDPGLIPMLKRLIEPATLGVTPRPQYAPFVETEHTNQGRSPPNRQGVQAMATRRSTHSNTNGSRISASRCGVGFRR
jgi:hypothetical protein